MAPPQQRPLSSLGGWRNRSVESLELARISTQLSTRDSIYPVPPVPVLDPSRVSKYESGADGSVTRKKDKKGDASSRKSHDPQRHSKKKSAAAAASSSAADDKHAGNKEVDDDESAGTVVAPAAGDDDEDPYGHLPEHQAEILKRQVETNQKNYSFWSIFRYATTFDIVIMAVAGITSIASGAAMPAMTIIFGGFQSTFQAYMVTGELTFDEFKNEMAQSVLYFVYLAIGTFFATYISTVGFLYTGEHITTNLRVAYLESCLKQNIGFFDKVGAGEVAVKITSDANRIQDGISEKLGLLLAAISTLISGFVIGFIVSWKLTLILASSFFAMFINTAIWGTLVGRYSIPLMINTAKASSLTQEMMSSIRVAIAFSSQDRLTAQYDRLLKIAQRDGFKVKAAIGMMIGIVMGLSHLSYGLGFWQGSNMLARGELEVNEVVTSIMAVMIGSFNVGAIGPYMGAINAATSTAGGVLSVIDRDTPLDAVDDKKGMKPMKLEGHLRVENIKHIYPSRPGVTVLNGVTLDFPAGKTTALVGGSGSGKSTIVGLIERFYNPIEGTVFLDGQDISKLNLRWLRQQIGLVAQEPTLFAGSILENISFGLVGSMYEHADEETQREMIISAAKSANAHEFISQLPEGYETKVGQRGSMLSGGQKQRIAIARAIVSDPKILLLDEATSALDTKSEGVVQAALDNASVGRTTITIAHRLSTIRDAHNIVVMNTGRVVEQGSHEKLMSMRGAYYDLVQAQNFSSQRRPSAVSYEEDEDEEKEKQMRRLTMVKNVPSYPVADGRTSMAASRRSSFRSFRAPSMISRRSSMHPPSMIIRRSIVINDEGHEDMLVEEEPTYTFMSLVKFTFGFSKPEKLYMVIALGFCIICGLATPVQSVFFAKQMSTISFIQPNAIDKWLWQGQSDFWSQMLLMLGLVTMVSHSIQGVSFAHIAEALIRRVRRETLKNIMRQDVGFFDQERHTPGALTAFLAVETTQLTNISGGTLGNIVISLTTIVGGTVLSVAIGWKLALVCLSVVPLLILCGFLRFYVLQKYSKRAALVYAESAAYAAENIAAIKTVASLTLESQAFTIYRDAVESQRKSSFGSVSKSGAIYAASQAMLFLCMALGFWYGSTLLATLEYDTFQFYVCLMAVIVGTSNSGSLLTFIPDVVKAKYSASQLRLIFDRTPSIDVWEKKGRKVKAVQGYLEFRNVYFRYPTRPEKPILRGISFKVEPGQHVALVGGSGSGKSTIISLLERFYDPFIGQITIDCVDISKLHVNNYRSHIALVSQEPALFQGTIRDNICLGVESEEVSDHDIEMACRDANIYDFIASLPDGFNTDIGNAGGMLSGGQKQRIAIARAMLRNPKVLLLDEATSALDSESEHIVQTALDRASKGRTTVTIAHRLTTVQNADIIHVIEAGRIEESGNHRQLMALNGRYAELVKMQSLA